MTTNTDATDPSEPNRHLMTKLFDDSDTDCIKYTVESNNGNCVIQATNFTGARSFQGFNVCDFDELDAERIAHSVGLEVEDLDTSGVWSSGFVLFESSAEDGWGMADELEMVLDGIGGNAIAPVAEEQELDNPGPIVEWLHDKLRL